MARKSQKEYSRRHYLKNRPGYARRQYNLLRSFCDCPDALDWRGAAEGCTPYDDPGWWAWSRDKSRLRAFALDCHARIYLHQSANRCLSGRLDYEYINQPVTATPLAIPVELRWPTRKPDLSWIREPDCLQMMSGQWVCLGALYRLSTLGPDRWYYLCQYRQDFERHAGEWMVIHRHEVPQIFPSKGLTEKKFRQRSRHLLHVVRDPVTRHPIQLRVYTLRYVPEFSITLNFREPFAGPSVQTGWWTDDDLFSSLYRNYLEQQSRDDAVKDVA